MPTKKEGKEVTQRRAKPAPGPAYATRPEVLREATDMAQRLGLDPAWVRHAIGRAHYQSAIARAVVPAPSGVPKNWNAYRARFVEPVRIAAGVRFWQRHRAALERAQAQTGVPPAIVVGILGVETLYGQHTGNYRVMDALCTLAFDFPAQHPRSAERSAFFRSELEAFLRLTRRTGTDPLALRGSYAGALGLPQFMPSSWERYALDFDGDGHIDLFHSAEDAIGSVAHYFQAFHWKPGMPTHYAVQLNAATVNKAALLAPDILPTFTAASFAALGANLEPDALAHDGLLALVELHNGDDAPLYIAGSENFYAITRYNWSSYYALAVIELGRAVAAAMPQ